MDKNIQKHWDVIYKTKHPNEVSWTQEFPSTSIELIHSLNLPKSAKLIDVGGGDSKLVDYLLQEGFENITVLDISKASLEKTKNRLGFNAKKVKWIVSDVTDFKPEEKYDVWHDRATFHFLISPEQIRKYFELASATVTGYLIVGTFSDLGPGKCSGLPVKQYNEKTLTAVFKKSFDKIHCITEDHLTPSNEKQNFIFCSFKRHDNN